MRPIAGGQAAGVEQITMTWAHSFKSREGVGCVTPVCAVAVNQSAWVSNSGGQRTARPTTTKCANTNVICHRTTIANQPGFRTAGADCGCPGTRSSERFGVQNFVDESGVFLGWPR